MLRGKGRKWVCSLKADGCGRHEVQNSAFPRGMRHRPEEPRGTPREVGNALRSEGREKIMSSVSVRAYFGESRRCGVGFSFGVDRFSMRALAFGGPAPFGNGGTGRKRCKPRRTCGYFMKHQSEVRHSESSVLDSWYPRFPLHFPESWRDWERACHHF